MTKTIILGKYQIIKELGRGGFGVVYEAKDIVLGRHIAIKVLYRQLTVNPLFLEDFKQEVRSTAQMEHPNIVPVHDIGQDKGYNYIAMRFMEGASLQERLQKQGALDPDQAKRVFKDILDGVTYIHQQKMIHRNLKPSNILFDQHNKARVSDLGFAKAMRTDVSGSMSGNDGMVGATAYMAPEIWHGKGATEQSDIYSLGCIAHEMLTGRLPFFGETPTEAMTNHLTTGPRIDERLPGGWRKLIEKCLAKDLYERYQTTEEILADLQFAFSDLSRKHQSENIVAGIGFDLQGAKKPERAQHPGRGSGSQNLYYAGQGKPFESHTQDRGNVHAPQARMRPNPAAMNMTDHRDGRCAYDHVSEGSAHHSTPARNMNPPEKQRGKGLMQKLIYAGLALIFLAAVVTSAFLINENRKARSERDHLANMLLTPNITEIMPDNTATPTPEIIIPSGQITAMKAGHFDAKLGYQDYDIGGPDYPRWSVINSGSPEIIRLGGNKQLNDELMIETFGDVGVMFSIGSQAIGDFQNSNNQFFVYGGSSLTVKNRQGVTDISLSEGGIYLKLTGRSEIANIVFPNHQNALAKLTGGSGLLITETNSVGFWCLSEECQFEPQDGEVIRIQQGQIRVYDSLRDALVEPAENYSAPSERYQEYLHWNEHCNRCLPFDLVPEPTPTLVYFTPTPAPDRENVPAEPTPTATTEVTPSKYYKLTVNVEGQGSVSPPGGTYNAGTVVTLTASPADGWEFAGWSNGATSPTTTVTMNSDVSITARFTKKAPTMYTLSVGVEGQGSVSPPGGTYEAGTVVILTASPATDWEFAGWNPGGSSNPLTVTMDSDISIMARFNKKAPTKYRLTVMAGQGGTVEPSSGTFDPGTSVTITAYPYDGYEVDSWSTGETGNSITVVMDSNKMISVTFKPIAKTISFSMPKLTGFVGNEGIVYSNNGSYEAVISSR